MIAKHNETELHLNICFILQTNRLKYFLLISIWVLLVGFGLIAAPDLTLLKIELLKIVMEFFQKIL